MGQKIATEQVIADLPDGRTVIIANPGEPIPDVPIVGYVEGGEVPDANVVNSSTLKGDKAAAGDDSKTEPSGPAKFEGNKEELIAALIELGEKDFDKKAKREVLDELYAKAIKERDEQEKSLQSAPNDKSLGPDSAENK